MPLHDDEVPAGPEVARGLVARHLPHLADRPLAAVGGGTDNTLYRLGDDLLLRLPRTPGTAEVLRKEATWLPWLGERLSCRVPEPVCLVEPDEEFSLPWAVYGWIDGATVSTSTVTDWSAYGVALAGLVGELHALDLAGVTRGDGLASYRGGELAPHDAGLRRHLDALRALPTGLDTDRLLAVWEQALALPPPTGPHVWMHTDLKPTNVLVRDGRLHAVIDWGGLSIGWGDAEHAPVWDLPAQARAAYRGALGLDEETWQRARGWAVLVGVSGVPYYWDSLPGFAAECVRRLGEVLS